MRNHFIERVVTVGVSLLAVATGFLVAQTEKKEAPPSAPRPLTVDDQFKILGVDDPQVSPDGKWVAYTVTTQDLEKDESKTRIWMAPTGGGEPVPMTAQDKSASWPRWSPDGRYLAFLTDPEDGKDQVWRLFREGGEAVQLTDTAQDVDDFEWSPDGKRMVLVLQDPTLEELAVKKGEK